MVVMPICVTERNWLGFSVSLRAMPARWLPLFASFCNLAFREESKAVSAMIRTALITSKIPMVISPGVKLIFLWEFLTCISVEISLY